MAEKITPRAQDFSEWYQDLVLQAKMADYSPVKGCMVIRPHGYAVWERIQRELDNRIKANQVRNAYFPVFIPESFLKKEAEHVEGFAPQCAVVTYAGAKDLEEKLVVRPTSETIINSMFAKWIQSYRDLPLLINQWANVVRWEMRTRLFLRTTEFLWQEGHTCHATPDEAEHFARKMLAMYQEFSENVLAMPVLAGLKTESEKFAGALRTYCIEAMMQDKKALQAGTSHNLADNFAKSFGTQFLDSDSKQKTVHQTSWGVSTRLIGGLIMTHSDDKGLILPPMVAPLHVAIIPILGKDPAVKPQVLEAADTLRAAILGDASVKALPHATVVEVDRDENKQPGWKFHEYELMGVPLRIELGPKDLDKRQCVIARRDTGEKKFIPLAEAPAHVGRELAALQKDLLDRARKHRDENIFEVATYEEFKKRIDGGGFFRVSWHLDKAMEAKIKEETKATIRCIELDQNFAPIRSNAPCFMTGKKSEDNVRVIFARSY